jgi:hypothetical protein
MAAKKPEYLDPITNILHTAKSVTNWDYTPEMIPSLKVMTDPSRCTLDSSDPLDETFLRSLVLTGGNQQYVWARRDSAGDVWVFDGRRRLGGTITINANPSHWAQFTPPNTPTPPLSLKVAIMQVTEEEAWRLAIHGNNSKPLSPIDKAFSARSLSNLPGWDQEKAAAEMGVSGAQVSLLLRLLTFPQRVQIAVHRGTMKVSEAHKLYGEPLTVVDAIMDQLDRGCSHSEVFAELKKAKREKVAAEKASNPSIAKRAPSRSRAEFKSELEVISASADVPIPVANLAGKLLDHLDGNESLPLVDMLTQALGSAK